MRNTDPPVRRASPLLPIFAGVFFLATLALIAKVATAGTMMPIVVVPTAAPSPAPPPPPDPPTPSTQERWAAMQMTAAVPTATLVPTPTAPAPTPLWVCPDVVSGPCQIPPTPPVVTPDPHGGLPTCPTVDASNECFKVPPTVPAPNPTGAPLPVPPR